MRRKLKSLSTIFIVIGALFYNSYADDLKLSEIIQRHLESIGKAEIRSQITNQLASGLSDFKSKLPEKEAGGKALVVSDADNLFLMLSLSSKEYPFEKVGYFKGETALPWVTAGARSPLGAFINEHRSLLRNGLFLGSMTSRWILLDPKMQGGKLNLGRSKSLGGRKVYTIEYFPADLLSNEFKLRIYIDTETFRHVRTEYRHEITPKEDKWGTLGTMGGAILEMSEEFSDFRTVNGLTFPYDYKAKYTSSSQDGTFQYDWGIKVWDYYFNQKLAPGFFSFDSNSDSK